MNLKLIVRWLLTETHKEYFIVEISKETDRSKDKLSFFKEMGGNHKIVAEIAEKTGVVLYANDLCTSIYAPLAVKRILSALINEHGLQEVTEEIARQIQNRHLLIEDREEIRRRFFDKEEQEICPEYPECPFCHSVNVSENHIGGGVEHGAGEYYCWECCQTFS